MLSCPLRLHIVCEMLPFIDNGFSLLCSLQNLLHYLETLFGIADTAALYHRPGSEHPANILLMEV